MSNLQRFVAKRKDGFPRRNDILLSTGEENAIREVVNQIEHLGAHEWLTDVVVQLDRAREALADWEDAGRPGASNVAPTDTRCHLCGEVLESPIKQIGTQFVHEQCFHAERAKRVEEMRERAERGMKFPQGVVVDASDGFTANTVRITTADGQDLAKFVRRGELHFDGGEANRLYLELFMPLVISQVAVVETFSSFERALDSLRNLVVNREDTEEWMSAVSEAINDIQNEVLWAKYAIDTRNSWNGATLWQHVATHKASKEDGEEAEQFNLRGAGGIRVFPVGPAKWRAFGRDDDPANSDEAFGETPKEAIANYFFPEFAK